MKTSDAVAALAALAQDTRLAVFRLLVEAGPEGMTVGRIGDAVKAAPATLSFHLKELMHAGLIASRQEGRFIWYSAHYEAMNGLIAYLTENCCRGNPAACGVDAVCTPSACAPPKAAGKKRRTKA